jgi:hypothetical protein
MSWLLQKPTSQRLGQLTKQLTRNMATSTSPVPRWKSLIAETVSRDIKEEKSVCENENSSNDPKI